MKATKNTIEIAGLITNAMNQKNAKTTITKYWNSTNLLLTTMAILVLICVLTLISIVSDARPEGNKISPPKTDSSAQKATSQNILSCTWRLNSGKVYINWKISGENTNCLFFVQRSVNNRPFETIEIKDGIKTDPSLTILYCFIDEEPAEGVLNYRISQVTLKNPVRKLVADKNIYIPIVLK